LRLSDEHDQFGQVIDRRWEFLIAALPLMRSEFAEGNDEPG
jgi:hypothetical protein